jgi:regulator of ribonuclease activity A
MWTTCDWCDAHKTDATGAFRVLPAGFQSYGALGRFAGTVTTVQCFEDNTAVKTMVDQAGDGRVLVVDAGASLRKAVLGGNLGAAAARNGWAGVVINGCVRDLAELRACEVGILALGHVPMPTIKRDQGLVDIPVQIHGVWVRPGDWLYADEDGVVISAQPLA